MSQTKPQSPASNPPEMSPTNAPVSATKKRRLIEAALFFFALAATVAFVTWFLSAWQQTQRQELYLPQLEAQARRDPYNGPILALTGGRELEAGDYGAAADTLRRAIGAGEATETVWQGMAAATAASGDSGRAIADLRIAAHAQHQSPTLEAALARIAALGPAATPFAVARAISPQGPQPLLAAYGSGSVLNGLADWWGRHHPEDSGYATRERWVTAEPDDAEAVRLWGLALERNRRLTEALAALHQAVALAPRSPDAHLALAGAMEQAGLTSDSSLEYLTALKLHPRWLPALLGLGRVAQEQGLGGYASAAFTQATQIAPGNPDAWIGLGRYALSTDTTYDQAAADFQKAAALAPQRTDFFCEDAQALTHDNQWDAAEALLRRRIQAAPEDAFAHYLLGYVLQDDRPTPEREIEAEAETREALRLAPHNAPTETQLAQILLYRGQATQARDLLMDATAQNPYDRNALLLLAHAEQQTGQTALSQVATQKAALLLQTQGHIQVLEDQEHQHILNPRIHWQLAALYTHNGQPALGAREAAIARMMQANPALAAKSLNAFHAQVQNLLPGD